MALSQRPRPPIVPDPWRPVWNEQYQRYFFVNRVARRPTWTNPTFRERRRSEPGNASSGYTTASEDSSTAHALGPSPVPGPDIEELPITLFNENEPPRNEHVREDQPSLETVDEIHIPATEDDFQMSGALSSILSEDNAKPSGSNLEENVRPSVSDHEENAQTPVSDHEEHVQSPVHGSQRHTATNGPAEARSTPDESHGRPRRRDWLRYFRSPKQHPDTLHHHPVPPQESLASPSCEPRPQAQSRLSNQRGASQSPPTLRPPRQQQQRQTRSEEHAPWMPDMTGYQGSDGARFYWLDPAFIAKQEAEDSYSKAQIDTARRIWETQYRGNGFNKVDHHEISGGGSYGMGSAGGFSGIA